MSEPENGAVTHANIPTPPMFTYHFPQGSPCGAVFAYKKEGDAVTLITTVRATHVGPGRSATAGGFWEVGSMLPKDVDTMQDGTAEIYREMHEELGEDIKTILPYDVFASRVEHLWDGMIRKRGNIVHAVTQKMIELTPDEFDKIIALPKTDEQRGIKCETFLTRHYKDAAEAERDVQKRLSDFRNADELAGAVRWFQKLDTRAHALC